MVGQGGGGGGGGGGINGAGIDDIVGMETCCGLQQLGRHSGKQELGQYDAQDSTGTAGRGRGCGI